MTDYEIILHFWFGDLPNEDYFPSERSQQWFRKSKTTDETIRQQFEPSLRQAKTGALDDWAETPRGRLGLIILLDQFSRNIYRDSPQAFAQDSQARQLCMDGLARGQDQDLKPIERLFFYLPLEHSEALEHQNMSVKLSEEVVGKAAPALAEKIRSFWEFAVKHREIIESFGRFPHRNKVLGRASTPEEIAFLQQPGSSF